MKYFVMSDLHGSSYYTKKVLDVYRAGEYEKILLLGDVLYHGPRNDLPKDYATKEVIKMLNPLKDEILAVRGSDGAGLPGYGGLRPFRLGRQKHFLKPRACV